MATTGSSLKSPAVAVSLHAWDPYYRNPGPQEVMGERLRAHLDAIARLNKLTPGTVTRVRVDMGWSTSQPNSGPPREDHYYNQRFVNLFDELRARDLVPYVVVHQSPAWARPAGAPAKHLPTDLDAFANWAAWFADFYEPWVREVQVWNEPNLEAFSGPRQNTPDRYVPVLKAFATAAWEANPKLRIIGGNVSQCDWWWLRRAYDAGFGDYCDIVGVHPYQGRQSIRPTSVDVSGITKAVAGKPVTGWEKSRISYGLPKVVETMRAAGDGDKPLWACEVGWSASKTGVGSDGVGSKWANQQEKAAAYQTELLEMLTTGRDGAGYKDEYQAVRLLTVYQVFDPLSKDPHQKGFEIVHSSGSLRPQARALAGFRRKYRAVRPLH